MPMNRFMAWSKKLISKGGKHIDKPEAGPNPKPEFRQTGKSPEDTSGFPANK